MQIKVDEDLPRLVINLLRDKGYQADNVVEEGMSGWKDGEHWTRSFAKNARSDTSGLCIPP
jgi:hypothetical protein